MTALGRTIGLWRSPAGALSAITLSAIVLRLLWQWRTGFYVSPSVWEYDAIARNIVEGRGYSYTFLGTEWRTFGSPVFPVLLAALHWLGGGAQSYGPIGLALAGLSGCLCLTSFAMGRSLFSRQAALFGAAIVAIHPALIVYSAQVHELTLDAFLLSLFVAVALSFARRPGARPAIGLGVVAGLAGLARPTIALFQFATYAWLAVRGASRLILLAAAITLTIGLSWTIRDWVAIGTPAAPLNCALLWMGNNPSAGGGTMTPDGRSVFDDMSDPLRRAVVGQPEVAQGAALCADATRFITADPGGFVRWWGTKLFYFWWFAPLAGILYPAGWIDLYRVVYLVEALFAIVGIAWVWTRGWRYGLIVVALELATMSVVQSFVYVEGRHRLMLEPTIAALAGIGVANVVARLPRRGQARVVPAVST